jgi:MCP family monocarboxylic acid transporter-like MFS transporter 9
MGIVKNDAGITDFVAPDGGWGWVVAFSSLMIHFIMDGITYSLGTYLSVFVEYFNVSYGEASIVHSLLPAVTLVSGPIASILTNKYGCRLTTIIGSFVAALGFVLSFFVKKFFFLYLTIGVVVGKFKKIFQIKNSKF